MNLDKPVQWRRKMAMAQQQKQPDSEAVNEEMRHVIVTTSSLRRAVEELAAGDRVTIEPGSEAARALASHDALLAACKAFVDCQDEKDTMAFNMRYDRAVSEARAAIAAAEPLDSTKP